MSPRSDDEIDYLLSRGKLGGTQRQRILDAALGASREGSWSRRRRRLAWSVGGLALATGMAVSLLVLRTPDREAVNFRLKGSGDAALITVACLGGKMTACPSGSKLAFAVEGGRDKGGFLTAYADPLGPGERIWFLTNEWVGAPQGESSRRVLRKAALVDDDQPAERYRLHAIFSPRSLAREAVVARAPSDALAWADLDLVVGP